MRSHKMAIKQALTIAWAEKPMEGSHHGKERTYSSISRDCKSLHFRGAIYEPKKYFNYNYYWLFNF